MDKKVGLWVVMDGNDCFPIRLFEDVDEADKFITEYDEIYYGELERYWVSF